MADKILLVQGDTLPKIVTVITDEESGLPVDVSGATVVLKFRKVGAAVLTATLTGTLLAGLTNADGSITSTPPYDTPGAGGRVEFAWTSTALAATGNYEGEIEVTFPSGGIQTVYERLKFQVRGQF